jgi:hypothetical protein
LKGAIEEVGYHGGVVLLLDGCVRKGEWVFVFEYVSISMVPLAPGHFSD